MITEINDLFDSLHSKYADIMADIIIGKNLYSHFNSTLLLINDCDEKIEQFRGVNNADAVDLFSELKYDFCLLKDIIVKEINAIH